MFSIKKNYSSSSSSSSSSVLNTTVTTIGAVGISDTKSSENNLCSRQPPPPPSLFPPSPPPPSHLSSSSQMQKNHPHKDSYVTLVYVPIKTSPEFTLLTDTFIKIGNEYASYRYHADQISYNSSLHSSHPHSPPPPSPPHSSSSAFISVQNHHVSLSRACTLTYAQIALFVSAIKKAIGSFHSFHVSFRSFPPYAFPNADNTSTALALLVENDDDQTHHSMDPELHSTNLEPEQHIQQSRRKRKRTTLTTDHVSTSHTGKYGGNHHQRGLDSCLALIRLVDRVMVRFEKPVFHYPPMPHVTLAWIKDSNQQFKHFNHDLHAGLWNVSTELQQKSKVVGWSCQVSSVECRIGSHLYEFSLDSS